MDKKTRPLFFRAVFLLVGTVIGAGIFSLPYVFSLSGVIFSVLGLVGLTVVVLAINLFYLRIITATNGDHQLPGYGERYLGEWGKNLGILFILLSCWGALLAYVILGGDFLALLFGQQSSFFHSFLFWSWGVLLFWQGLSSMTAIGGWLTGLLILLAIAMPLLGNGYFQKSNLVLLPLKPFAFYGPLLFSLSGMAVIPEVEEVLRSRRRLLPRAVVLGMLIPGFVYAIFGFGVWAISGAVTTVDALSGLLAWSPILVKVGAVIGFLATFTSFLSLTNVVKEVFLRDLGRQEKTAKAIAVFLSFPATFLSLKYFLPLISLTGALAVGGGGILILIIFLKKFARSWSERLLAWLVLLVLLGGVVSELMG